MDDKKPIDENLPINVEDQGDHGTITYATEVISTIVGVATAEVEGIASMAGASSISDILGRSKNVNRGVKVEVGAEEVSVEVSVIVDYGMPIQKVCQNVQDNILKSIETMTGLHVIKVDVHVQGVSFEKENLELKQGQEVARLTSERAAGGASPETAPADEFDLDSVLPEEQEEPFGDVIGMEHQGETEMPAEPAEGESGPAPTATEEQSAAVETDETTESAKEKPAKGKKTPKGKGAGEA